MGLPTVQTTSGREEPKCFMEELDVGLANRIHLWAQAAGFSGTMGLPSLSSQPQRLSGWDAAGVEGQEGGGGPALEEGYDPDISVLPGKNAHISSDPMSTADTTVETPPPPAEPAQHTELAPQAPSVVGHYSPILLSCGLGGNTQCPVGPALPLHI